MRHHPTKPCVIAVGNSDQERSSFINQTDNDVIKVSSFRRDQEMERQKPAMQRYYKFVAEKCSTAG